MDPIWKQLDKGLKNVSLQCISHLSLLKFGSNHRLDLLLIETTD